MARPRKVRQVRSVRAKNFDRYKPGIGQLPLPDTEEFETKVFRDDAVRATTEWLKPKYYGKKPGDFAEMPDDDRRNYSLFFRSGRFMSVLWGTTPPEGELHRAFVFDAPDKARKITDKNPDPRVWVTVSGENAFHLGRHPALLSDKAIHAAVSTARALDYSKFKIEGRVPNRFEGIVALVDQVLRPERRALKALFDGMNMPPSNGERFAELEKEWEKERQSDLRILQNPAVEHEDGTSQDRSALRVELAKTVLDKVFYPMVETVGVAEGWGDKGIEDRLLVLDHELFFAGTQQSRRSTWVSGIRGAMTYYDHLESLAQQQANEARRYPDDPAFAAAQELIVRGPVPLEIVR